MDDLIREYWDEMDEEQRQDFLDDAKTALDFYESALSDCEYALGLIWGHGAVGPDSDATFGLSPVDALKRVLTVVGGEQ